jgi:hypothetical protein
MITLYCSLATIDNTFYSYYARPYLKLAVTHLRYAKKNEEDSEHKNSGYMAQGITHLSLADSAWALHNQLRISNNSRVSNKV